MSPRVGTLLIIVSSAAFGAMAIFARFAYAEGVDPISLLALRFSIAAAALWALMLARRLPVPRGKTLAGLIGMGGALYVVQAFTYFTAITMAPAGLVALLLYLYPAMVTAAAVLLLGERMTAVKAAALALALAGTAITIGPSAGGRPLGVALGVASAVVYSSYVLIGSRVTTRAGAVEGTTVILTSAAVVYLAVAAFRGMNLPTSAVGWGSLAAMAIVSTVLASVAFFAGLRRVGPATAATVSTVEPAVTVALDALIFGAPVTWYLAIGGSLILAAVVLLARAGGEPERDISLRPVPGA